MRWPFFKTRIDEPPVLAAEEPVFYWAMADQPICEASQHMLVTGARGSGKTMLLRLLMQSVLPLVGSGLDQRALLFDYKREMASYLAAYGVFDKTLLFDPFDQRGVIWDVAKDVRSHASIQQFAATLIAEPKESKDPFFTLAAREVLAELIAVLVSDPVTRRIWTLRDVLLLAKSEDRLRRLLSKAPQLAEATLGYMADERLFANIHASVLAALSPYRIVAALWDYLEQVGQRPRVSLIEQFRDERVVVLGYHPNHSEAVTPIMRAIFRRYAELALRGAEVKQPRTWIMIDEVSELGPLHMLRTLLNTGRSKGVAVALGFQDISGIWRVYGQHDGNEIVGQCGYKTFLRTDSGVHAKWVEEHFGEDEAIEEKDGESQTSGRELSTGTSRAYERSVRKAILGSEVMGLPRPTEATGLYAIHDNPALGRFYTGHIDGADLNEWLIEGDPAADSEHFATPEEAEELRLWDENSDGVRLGLSAAPTSRSGPTDRAPEMQGDAQQDWLDAITRL